MTSDQQTYLTRDGLEKLKLELENLRGPKRQEIAERISQAKELGDLSENAEYAEAKEAQAFNEGRVLEIETILKNAIIIEETKGDSDIVTVGAKIKIKEHTNDKKEKEFHIVGSQEADPLSGKISNESPIGQALLGGKKGDMIEIKLPKGIIKCEILEIN